MSEFLDFENESIRREILLILESDSNYAVNDEMLQKCLRLRAWDISVDRLTTQLFWLQEQGLIKAESVSSQAVNAKITQRGQDVALSRAQVPGIAKPRPEQ